MTDIEQQERGQESCGQEPPGGVPLSPKVQKDEIDDNPISSSRDEDTADDTSADNAGDAVLQAGDMLLDARKSPLGGGALDPQETSQVNDSAGIQLQASGVDSSSIGNEGEGENGDENLDHTVGTTGATEESSSDNYTIRNKYIDEEIEKMHRNFMRKLKTEITTSALLEKMKDRLHGGVDGLLTDELENVKTAADLLDCLEKNGTIKKGDYSTLIGVFWQLNEKAVIRLIEKTQRGIHKKEFQKAIRPQSSNHRGDVYDTWTKLSTDGKKGILIIINQFTDTRKGTIEDERSLTNLFKDLDFSIKTYRNISKQKLKVKLTKISVLIAEKEYPQMFLAMLSHGQKKGIQTCEPDKDDFITVQELTMQFKNQHCKHLRGKPKVFLIEACRGSEEMVNYQYDVTHDGAKQADLPKKREPHQSLPFLVSTPAESDVLICYSQFEGYKCVRYSSGSWFIQTFCETVERNHDHSHVLEMMTMVNKDVSEKIMKSKDFPNDPEAAVGQMPCQLSTLTKDIYL